MNINFNSGFNKVPVGQQRTRKMNAELTGQSVQTVNGSGETIPDMETHSTSYTQYLPGGTVVTMTVECCWEDAPVDPNNNISTADVLKLHKINYRNI